MVENVITLKAIIAPDGTETTVKEGDFTDYLSLDDDQSLAYEYELNPIIFGYAMTQKGGYSLLPPNFIKAKQKTWGSGRIPRMFNVLSFHLFFNANKKTVNMTAKRLLELAGEWEKFQKTKRKGEALTRVKKCFQRAGEWGWVRLLKPLPNKITPDFNCSFLVELPEKKTDLIAPR